MERRRLPVVRDAGSGAGAAPGDLRFWDYLPGGACRCGEPCRRFMRRLQLIKPHLCSRLLCGADETLMYRKRPTNFSCV